jgi:hypothetical protein
MRLPCWFFSPEVHFVSFYRIVKWLVKDYDTCYSELLTIG